MRPQEQSFNCYSKQEVSGESECGGGRVQRVQFRKDSEREKQRETVIGLNYR